MPVWKVAVLAVSIAVLTEIVIPCAFIFVREFMRASRGGRR